MLKGESGKRFIPHDAVAVATSNRVILFDEGLSGRIDVQYLPYQNIEAVTYRTGFMSSWLQISVRSGAGFKLDGVDDKDSVRTFADGVSAHADADPRLPPADAALVPPEPTSWLADLERLADLRDRGALTQEEYDAQKARLLGL